MPPRKKNDKISISELKQEALEKTPGARKAPKKPLSNTPYSLPEFLRWLNTKAKLSMSDSMQVASKLIPAQINSDNALYQATESTLRKFLSNEDHRKAILNAASRLSSNSTPKKRKREHEDVHIIRETIKKASDAKQYIYDEILDPGSLANIEIKSNRAPVMTAWAAVVAERIGFKREEALSLANVYTGLNAHAKAVSLSIQEKKSEHDMHGGPNQPTFMLMGRKIPCIQMRETELWRGLSDGKAVPPSQSFDYLVNTFKSNLGSVIGAMRLLVDDIVGRKSTEEEGIEELKNGTVAYSCYMSFRPDVPLGERGWGAKGLLKLKDILDCRRVKPEDLKPALEETDPVLLDSEDEALFEEIPGIENLDAESANG